MAESKQIRNTTAEYSRRTESPAKESLFKWVLRKVFPDQRKHERLEVPPLIGYLGTMRGSRPFDVGDVSLGGFSLKTGERWEPGTEMPVTLKRTNVPQDEHEDGFTVQATVVRWHDEGVGFSILLSEEESKAAYGNALQVEWASREEMQMFLSRLKGPEAESLAEANLKVASQEKESLRAALGRGRPMYTHSAGD